jgi:hypothetical protein
MLKSAVTRVRADSYSGRGPSLEQVLEELGMHGALWPSFVAHKVNTVELAAALTDEQMKELGVKAIGDRLLLKSSVTSVFKNEAVSRIERKVETISKSALKKLEAKRVVPIKKALLLRFAKLDADGDNTFTAAEMDAANEEIEAMVDAILNYWTSIGVVAALILSMTVPMTLESLEAYDATDSEQIFSYESWLWISPRRLVTPRATAHRHPSSQA